MPAARNTKAIFRRRLRRVGAWTLVWLGCLAIWMLLVAKLKTDELLVGLVAALLATIGVAVFQNADRTPFHPTPAMLLQAWRVPGDVLTGTWQVLHGLVEQLTGRAGPRSALLLANFEMGKPDDPKANARRALAITYTTLTPNTVVLGFIAKEQKMLVHQFQPTDSMAIVEALERCP